jgi:hypothetical protein
VRGGGAWHRGWAACVGRAPFQRRKHACSLRWRARGGLGDAVSLRSGGSDMRRRLGWYGVRWLFRGFCAGRLLGAYHGCCMRGGFCAERFITMHTLRIARSSAHLRVPIDPTHSQMPRNRLLPAPPARHCVLPLDVCRALHTKHALVVKTLGSKNPRAQFYYN